MFVCLHKNIVHFAKLRILPDREYDNEDDVSFYFARTNNKLIVCVIQLNVFVRNCPIPKNW